MFGTDVKKRFIQRFLKWNDLIRFGLIIMNIWLVLRTNLQAEQIELLTITNVSLLVQSSKNSKWSNRSPWAEWIKEYNPKTQEITMQYYNNALYKYLLEPLGYDRYYYVLKTDSEVFPGEMGKVFYEEEMYLVQRFLEGNGEMVIKEYKNEWTELRGGKNKDGYWRYVWQEDGHIYVGGRTNKPVLIKNLNDANN